MCCNTQLRASFDLFVVTCIIPCLSLRASFDLFVVTCIIPSVCRYVHHSMCLSLRASFNLFVVTCIIQSVCRYVHHSICLSLRASFHLFLHRHQIKCDDFIFDMHHIDCMSKYYHTIKLSPNSTALLQIYLMLLLLLESMVHVPLQQLKVVI